MAYHWFVLAMICENISVNLNGLQNHAQINTQDLSGIAIVERMKLQITAGKQFTTLAHARRKLLIGKGG